MYDVKVIEKYGTCDTDLFEKMAKKGDITATSIKNFINKTLSIAGFALCEITTEEKQFKIGYFDTYEYGFISTGSEIFYNSVKDYFGDVEQVRIVEVKTKQGKTYKAMPVLQKETINNETTKTDDEKMPF